MNTGGGSYAYCKDALNSFFHSRTDSLWIGGLMRIAFAILYIADRLLWTLDLDWLLSPSSGIQSYFIGRSVYNLPPKTHHLTIFSLAPDSDALFWFVHYLGIIQGILLLIGVAPRFQLVCVFVNMVSFQHLSTFVYDGQDEMFRFWAFFLLFIPLHTFTIYDYMSRKGKGDKSSKPVTSSVNSTWPMWPFRLWQIEVCLIYMGAGIGKATTAERHWINGNALWRVTHYASFYGGMFNPDFLFNYLGPLKILTWSSLCLELTCWILIWPMRTRWIMLAAIVSFHVGIDLAMNMHCFEWLSILGWMAFVPLPAEGELGKPLPTQSTFSRSCLNLFLFAALVDFLAESNPMPEIEATFPWLPLLPSYNLLLSWIASHTRLVTNPIGLYQGAWTMFKLAPNFNCQVAAKIKFEDGTEATWVGIDAQNLTWWEKKRYQRPLDYFDHLYQNENTHFTMQEAILQKLAKDYGEDVISVHMFRMCQLSPPIPPPDLGWFDYPAQQPMISANAFDLRYLNINDDRREECAMWASQNDGNGCGNNPRFMWQNCARSCRALGLFHPKLVNRGDKIILYRNEVDPGSNHERSDDSSDVDGSRVGIVISFVGRDHDILHFVRFEDSVEEELICLYHEDFEILPPVDGVPQADPDEVKLKGEEL